MAPSEPLVDLGAQLAALPGPLPARLRAVAAAAHGQAWLVGGYVRDLLLGREPGDVDVVVEGDALAVAAALPVTVLKETPFLTATVAWDDGTAWDLVTARSERYPEPAALPEVEPADIEADLRRRDFTVNAMAAALGEASWGRVLDPTGGLADLRARQIRILHPDSFRDDPTRVYRALRYAVRLGFEPDLETARALGEANVRWLPLLSPDRLRHELQRSLDAADAAAQAEAVAAFGTLCGIDLRLRDAEGRPARAEALRAAWAGWPEVADAPRWVIHVLGWLPEDRSRTAARALVARLGADREGTELIRAVGELIWQGPWSTAGDVVERHARVRHLAAAGRIALAARWPEIEADVAESFGWDRVRPELDGHEVMALGVPAGRAVGEVLERLRAGRLRGELTDRAGEVRAVEGWLREGSDGR